MPRANTFRSPSISATAADRISTHVAWHEGMTVADLMSAAPGIEVTQTRLRPGGIFDGDRRHRERRGRRQQLDVRGQRQERRPQLCRVRADARTITSCGHLDRSDRMTRSNSSALGATTVTSGSPTQPARSAGLCPADRDRRGRAMGSAGVVLHADGRGGDLCRPVFLALAIAALVPIAILAISDLLLPAYNNIPVLHRDVRHHDAARLLRQTAARRAVAVVDRGAVGAVCASCRRRCSIIVSNFAVWAFQSDYEKSLGRLGQLLLGGRAVLSLDARRRRFLSGRAPRLLG